MNTIGVRLLARATAAILIGVVLTGAARPQEPPARGGPAASGLEIEPLTSEGLGLRLNPPAGSVYQSRRGERGPIVTIVDGAAPAAWSVRIQTLVSTLDDPSPASHVAKLLEAFEGEAGTRVLENRVVTCDGRSGRLCYVQQETAGRDPVVGGWLFLPSEEKTLLVIALQVRANEWSRLRSVFDACFASIRLFAPREVADARRDRLELGRQFLDGVTEADLRALVGDDQWYRFYTEADGKSKELGYYRVVFRDGRLGEIDPSRPASEYDTAERESGLLVDVRGHYLEPETTYDSEAVYWLAWDRSHEAWSIRGTRRQGGKSMSEALTGIRTRRSTSDPAGTITVISSIRDGATRDQQSWRVPDVYLPQAMRWALGRLLPRDDRQPRVFSAYCFDNAAATSLAISLRQDRWEGGPSGSRRWILTSRARPDGPNIVTTYAADGAMIRRAWPDGAVTEPISLDALHKLWKQKGLPTGPLRR